MVPFLGGSHLWIFLQGPWQLPWELFNFEPHPDVFLGKHLPFPKKPPKGFASQRLRCNSRLLGRGGGSWEWVCLFSSWYPLSLLLKGKPFYPQWCEVSFIHLGSLCPIEQRPIHIPTGHFRLFHLVHIRSTCAGLCMALARILGGELYYHFQPHKT